MTRPSLTISRETRIKIRADLLKKFNGETYFIKPGTNQRVYARGLLSQIMTTPDSEFLSFLHNTSIRTGWSIRFEDYGLPAYVAPQKRKRVQGNFYVDNGRAKHAVIIDKNMPLKERRRLLGALENVHPFRPAEPCSPDPITKRPRVQTPGGTKLKRRLFVSTKTDILCEHYSTIISPKKPSGEAKLGPFNPSKFPKKAGPISPIKPHSTKKIM